MRFDWFKKILISQFNSVLGFSQISIRLRIPFGNSLLKFFIYVNDTHEILYCSVNFFQIFLNSGPGFQHDIYSRSKVEKTITNLVISTFDYGREIIMEWLQHHVNPRSHRKNYGEFFFPRKRNFLSDTPKIVVLVILRSNLRPLRKSKKKF